MTRASRSSIRRPITGSCCENGDPVVVRYQLEVYRVGAQAPFVTVDMGKPAPETDGKVRYDFSSLVVGWPLPGGDYEARVRAVGPAGSALSGPSNPFNFSDSPTCTFSLTSRFAQIPASGGNYGVDVSTGASCQWTATTDAPWVTMWTTGGTGNGTVAFDVKPNASSSSRTGTITIADQTLTLQQDGARTAPVLSWAAPAAITQGTALGATQLNATANVPGTFVYSPTAGTVLPVGTHTLSRHLHAERPDAVHHGDGDPDAGGERAAGRAGPDLGGPGRRSRRARRWAPRS